MAEKTETKKTTRKVSEDLVFYRSDQVLVCDCSKRGFPKKAPMWVVEAIANRIIRFEKAEGMQKEHWIMVSEEDGHISVLDNGRIMLTRYKGKYEPIPKVVMDSLMVVTKEKPKRK